MKSKLRRGLLLAISVALPATLVALSLVVAQEPGFITRLTTASVGGGRHSASPEINADGTKIVFHSDSDFLGQGIPDAQDEIWLFDANTGQLVRITNATGTDRDSLDPEVNADGTKIVFWGDSDFLGQQDIQNDQYEVWHYDRNTSTFRRLSVSSDEISRESSFPDINADGTKIVFHSDSDMLGQGIPNDQNEVWLYDTNSSLRTRITNASSADRDSGFADISADGTKIVFQSNSDFLSQGILVTQTEIWLYDTNTMTVTRLTTGSNEFRNSFDPDIIADGTKVVFKSDSDFLAQIIPIPLGQFEIWLLDITTMALTRVTTSADSRSSGSADISADGSKIVFRSDSDFLGQGIPEDQSEIWQYHTSSMTLTRITTASHSTRDSRNPDINADGTKVVFFSDSDFLSQGIPFEQYEIWLRHILNTTLYLPILYK